MPKVYEPKNKIHGYKTLVTSVIYIPMSPPSLYISEINILLNTFYLKIYYSLWDMVLLVLFKSFNTNRDLDVYDNGPKTAVYSK